MGSPRATATEPQVSKEDIGLSSSASSSSGLNTLSSRRLRPTSQKHTAQRPSGTNPPLAAHPAIEATFSHILHLPWLSSLSGEAHRGSPRSRAQRLVRSVFFLWTWFCLAYFTAVLFNALLRNILGWRNVNLRQKFHPQDTMGSPESILASLSLEHRMSKLSSLYPIPVSFAPFVLGPRRYPHNPLVACVWMEETSLARLQPWTASWLGPISLLVTTSAEPDSPAHKKLLTNLTLLSHTVPNISFHVLHTPSSLRNFNAYINLARLFSPSSQVLLFPPHAMSNWSPLPVVSTAIYSIAVPRGVGLVIPVRQLKAEATSSDTEPIDLPRAISLPSSALLIDRDVAPWCSERLLTMTERRNDVAEPSALDTEMATHWEECVWNVWLRMKGAMRVPNDAGWATAEMAQLPAPQETVETTLNTRIARKQRSETCVLVAKELMAQELWLESMPVEGSAEVADGEFGVEPHERRKRSHAKESSKAQWLRGICKETLERWGKEILD